MPKHEAAKSTKGGDTRPWLWPHPSHCSWWSSCGWPWYKPNSLSLSCILFGWRSSQQLGTQLNAEVLENARHFLHKNNAQQPQRKQLLQKCPKRIQLCRCVDSLFMQPWASWSRAKMSCPQCPAKGAASSPHAWSCRLCQVAALGESGLPTMEKGYTTLHAGLGFIDSLGQNLSLPHWERTSHCFRLYFLFFSSDLFNH